MAMYTLKLKAFLQLVTLSKKNSSYMIDYHW